MTRPASFRKVRLKTPADIARIRDAGRAIAEVFAQLEPLIVPGVRAFDLDSEIDAALSRRGCRASFKTIPDYSFASCISVNEEAVHGLPHKKKILRDGDIVKIDIGAAKNGLFADACRTFAVGTVSADAAALMRAAQEALAVGIAAAQPRATVGCIGHAIQEYLAATPYAIVRQYCGHGVGFAVHELPEVLHYGDGPRGVELVEGLVIAIEPILAAGSGEVRLLPDGWTAVTADGSLSAQYEHTVAITADGPVVLTGQ